MQVDAYLRSARVLSVNPVIKKIIVGYRKNIFIIWH